MVVGGEGAAAVAEVGVEAGMRSLGQQTSWMQRWIHTS